MKKAMAMTYYEIEGRKYHPKGLTLIDKQFNSVDFTGIIVCYTFDKISDYADKIVKLAKINGYLIESKTDGTFAIPDILFKDINTETYLATYCL